MSYQVLARKWRPKSFQQLMGQEHVVTVLTNALEQQRLHHAYLFTGTRGVGKTTIARIFAKSLNCDLGITSNPCGECDTCQDIDLGRFVDLLEIDAASRTKVDDTREILDNVQYAPTRGRYKVYLIDEVHMLSRNSFNALLKTLEEPPEHVKFILATTDPQKLPVTVLSRCLQFHLKALSVGQIQQQLKTILTAEQVTFEQSAITLLAKAARGSIRDSLSLTDQAIAQGQGNINLANVQQMLGGVDNNWVFKLLISLLKQDAQALMKLSLEIASYAPNYGRLLAEFIQLLHQIAMAQVVEQHFDLSSEHNLLLEKFCQAISPEDVQLYYQIVLTGRKDLPYASDEQAAFDMVLLRLLAFKPQKIALNSKVESKSETVIDFDDVALPETEINEAKPSAVEVSNTVLVDTKDIIEEETSVDSSKIEEVAGYSPPFKQTVQETPHVTEIELSEQMLAVEQIAEQQRADVDQQSPPVPFDNEKSVLQKVMPSDSTDSVHLEQDLVNEQCLGNEQIAQTDALALPQVKPSNTQPTAIETVLANRNMLRSRKKALEDEGKKSSGAEQRQSTEKQAQVQRELKEKAADVPSIDTVPDQPFTPDVINPAEIKLANQVDKWANMIDSMALNGRLRQLAIHSTICENSTEDVLVLRLDQATKHLKTEAAHKQLEVSLSQLLQRKITVELELVEQTKDDPFQIQTHINDKRYDYAKELLENDELIIAMQNSFQATIDENTISAR